MGTCARSFALHAAEAPQIALRAVSVCLTLTVHKSNFICRFVNFLNFGRMAAGRFRDRRSIINKRQSRVP